MTVQTRSMPSFGPVATAVPVESLHREASLEVAEALTPDEVPRKVLARLHDRVGIATRRVGVLQSDGSIPLYGLTPPGHPNEPRRPGTAERMSAYAAIAEPLAREAAEKAMDEAGIEPGLVTHLVTASCTGFGAPGVDLALVDHLGLPDTVRRTNVGFMGCHAAVNALATAAAHARESPQHRVLVVCVEVSSVHFHAGARLDRVISNILFSDGAAATVIGHDARPAKTRLAACRSRLIPDSHDAMGWEVGDHGFEMTLAAEVPDRIAGAIGDWVRGCLAEHDLSLPEVGGWAIHPGGPRVLDAVVAALDLPANADAASRRVLRDRGNMSSGTLLHILRELDDADVPPPWVGLAFGPGLAGELVLVT